ncbi:MAG: phosphate-starvation-inducible PsiE family protein [Pseudomonadota bacterium]
MDNPFGKGKTHQVMSGIIHQLENFFLLLIAVFTVIAMCQEVYKLIVGQQVALKDLLLMFIYVEVLAMVGVYYDSKKIPITLPLYIAITALARLVILQGKDQPPINLLVEAGAILILAAACIVITYKPGRSKSDDEDSGTFARATPDERSPAE